MSVNDQSNLATMPVAEESKLPPMLRSYLDYKSRYQDSLLLFQVGDFYETFFDDAVTIARALNVTLTSRDKNSPQPTPMAGVPIAVVDNYVERLVAQGYSVALVSQCEAPANGKGMFSRKLDRVVTPGVRILNSTQAPCEESYLASVALDADGVGAIAYTAVQTGLIWVREDVQRLRLTERLAQLDPAELVVPRSQRLSIKLPADRKLSVKYRAEANDFASARRFSEIGGFTRLTPQAKQAVKLLLSYLDETTVEAQVSVSEIRIAEDSNSMGIDSRTRANLELIKNLRDGSRENTLLSVLDYTVTPGGARLLTSWILNPLVAVDAIRARHSAVRFLKSNIDLQRMLKEQLTGIGDIERVAARIELQIATPREIGMVRDSAARVPSLATLLAESLADSPDKPTRLQELAHELQVPGSLSDLFARSLVEVPPLATGEAGIFVDGYHEEIDRLRAVKRSGASWITALEEKEKGASGIASLKIRFNNVIGYYFEVTRANLAKVPPHFIRKQSMVGGERYTTDELRRYEEDVLTADGKLCDLERRLFIEFRQSLREHVAVLRAIARTVAEVDVFLSLAEAADREDFIEPAVSTGRHLIIKNGKHPVLARLLRGSFVANSLELTAEGARCLILTGPNMGGKSTYLRQAALITIMAQMGSFVPADEAAVGIVDRIFARIGASDNMTEGESTFMVEMKEAANIIAHASAQSLLLIDELGRGTATADGLALARSIVEWIVDEIGARTLFATHYHELTTLETDNAAVANVSVGAVEEQGQVVFTHNICKGPANRSYGIEVARLAGLPINLLQRARGFLMAAAQTNSAVSPQLPLFGAVAKVVEPPDYAELLRLKRALLELKVDELSARECMKLIWDLHDRVQAGEVKG